MHQSIPPAPSVIIAKARHNALISYGNFAPVDTCTCKSYSWRKSFGLGFSFLSKKTGSRLVPCFQTPLQTPGSTLLIVLLKKAGSSLIHNPPSTNHALSKHFWKYMPQEILACWIRCCVQLVYDHLMIAWLGACWIGCCAQLVYDQW